MSPSLGRDGILASPFLGHDGGSVPGGPVPHLEAGRVRRLGGDGVGAPPRHMRVPAADRPQPPREEEATEAEPQVGVRDQDAPLAEPAVDGVLEDAAVRLDGALDGREEVHEAAEGEDQERHHDPRPVLPRVEVAEAEDGQAQEEEEGGRVDELHGTLAPRQSHLLLLALVPLHGAAEEEEPALKKLSVQGKQTVFVFVCVCTCVYSYSHAHLCLHLQTTSTHLHLYL